MRLRLTAGDSSIFLPRPPAQFRSRDFPFPREFHLLFSSSFSSTSAPSFFCFFLLLLLPLPYANRNTELKEKVKVSKVKWLEGYPKHWRTGEESPHVNFPSPRADLLALHHVCSMPFTTLSFDIWPTAIA